MNNSDKLEYRYLNMDTKSLVQSESELTEQLGSGAQLKTIPNYKFRQVLIAGSQETINEVSAIRLCKQLSKIHEDLPMNNSSETMNKNNNLKPCPVPWCNSNTVRIECDLYDSGPEYFAICFGCLTAGPLCDTAEGAAEEWNDRPAMVPVASLKELVEKLRKEAVSDDWFTGSDRYGDALEVAINEIEDLIIQIEQGVN